MTIEQKIEKSISDDMQYLARVLWAARPAAKKKPRDKKADAKRRRIVTKKAREADAERRRKGMDKEKAHIKTVYDNQRRDGR